MSVHDTLPRRLTAPQLVGAVAAAAAISLALLAPLEHLTGRSAGAAVALVTSEASRSRAGPTTRQRWLSRGASLIARFAGKAPKVRW